jgi:hypothetical protein
MFKLTHSRLLVRCMVYCWRGKQKFLTARGVGAFGAGCAIILMGLHPAPGRRFWSNSRQFSATRVLAADGRTPEGNYHSGSQWTSGAMDLQITRRLEGQIEKFLTVEKCL